MAIPRIVLDEQASPDRAALVHLWIATTAALLGRTPKAVRRMLDTKNGFATLAVEQVDHARSA